jgi:RNA polymerase sigma factor (sigma-70 family)
MGDMRQGANREPSDEELVAASRRGERAAFGQLIERYQDVVCAVSFSSTGDWSLSEDVAQDTFIAAWHRLAQLREAMRLRAWLCGIARNLARKARRRTAREEPVDGELPALGGSPFEDIARAEADRVVRDALDRIPAAYREALVLYYRDDQSMREVASSLAISEAAALQRISRGRRYLAEGVTRLVESSLQQRRPRTRNIVAGALAAIGAVSAPSRVDASPTKGSTMLMKAAIAIGLLSATGATAYVVHEHHASNSAPQPSSPAELTLTTPAPVHTAPPTPTLAPPRGQLPAGVPANALRAPDPDVVPSVSKDTIARLKLYDGPARGPADAPVTIVVFQDNLCPYCGHALGTIDQLFDEYPGKLRLLVKQLPVHAAARLSAEASYAADAQGKFWDMHDMLLSHQEDLSRDALISYAKQIGLDVDAFTAALDRHTFAPAVAADVAAAKELGIHGTPSFVINGRQLAGARQIDEFRATIDQALAEP